MASNRKLVVWLTLLPLAYMALLFGHLLWDPAWAVLFRDAGTLTIPARHLLAESLARFHELPGWNPYVLGGAPFLADPSFATFYPLNLIFLLFSDAHLPFAHTWFLAVHIPLAFAGLYLLFRRIGSPQFFAVMGALSIAGGGYAVASLYMSGAFGGLLACGWLGYFWTRFLEEKKPTDLFLASFFLSLPIYSGDPQWAYMLGVFLVPGLAVTRLPLVECAKWGAALGFLTLLVCAPQLLPTADLLMQSPRDLGGGLPVDAETWSLNPIRFIEWILPLPFGTEFYMDGGIRRFTNGPDPMPFLFSIYCGFFFLPALLASITRAAWRDSAYRVWFGVGALFVLLSMGSYSPIPVNAWFALLVPGWGSFRYPERLTIFAQIGFLLAIAVALRHIDLRVFLRRFAWWALGAAGVGCILALFRYPDALMLKSAPLPIVMFTALALVLLRREVLVRREGWLLVMLVAFTAVELAGGLRSAVWQVPSKIASPDWPPYMRLIRDEWGPITMEHFPRFFCQDERYLNWDDLDRIAGDRLDNVPGKLTVHQWLSLTLNTGAYFGVGTPLGFTTLMHRRQRRFWDTVAVMDPSRAFALKGTDYLGRRLKNKNYALSTNPEKIPLFWVPSGIDFFTNERDALKRMATREWDWRHRITVEAPEKLNASTEQEAKLTFEVVRRTFNALTVKITAAAATKETWVLWNESNDHFWSAYFRSQEIPLTKGNYWANALLIPPMEAGESQLLDLRYENPLLAIGAALAGVWALLWALFYTRSRKAK